MEKEDLIIVTGATGQQGGAVARELLAAGRNVRVMTRNPHSDKAKQLGGMGATVVRADLDDPASLEAALDGAWGVFAVQNPWEAGVEREEVQGKRIAEMAKEKGVRHFVYTSVASAQHDTGIPHFDSKWRVEEKIRDLNLPSYAIIRPVFFMENWLSPWFKPAIDGGKLMIALKLETSLQMIALKDIGKYGALAFEQHERMNGKEIDIAGDECTMPEAAEIIGRTAGRELTFEQAPIESVREMSDDFATMFEWFDAVGYSVDIAGNESEYGIPATTLEDWAASVDWG